MFDVGKVYSQAEVDDLHRQWESGVFEQKTKEVLGGILKRLDESNNYKATIGKDIIHIAGELQEMKVARQTEIDARKESQQWHQSWWVRVGIGAAIIFQLLNFLVNTGAIG